MNKLYLKNYKPQFLKVIMLSLVLLSCTVGTDEESYIGIDLVEDTEGPRIKILYPASEDTVDGAIPLVLDFVDLSGISSIQIYLDDIDITDEVEISNSGIIWNTVPRKGDHNLKVYAKDNFGNIGESETSNFYIRNITFRNIDSELAMLPINEINHISYDFDGNWYISSKNELWIRQSNGGLTTYNANNSDLLASTINTVFVDGDSLIWIGTSSGVFKFDRSKFEKISFPNGGAFNLSSSHIQRDKDGNLWIGTVLGVFKFLSDSLIAVGGGLSSFPIGGDGSRLPRYDPVYDLILNQEGYPVVAMGDGLFRYYGSDWSQYSFIEYFLSVAQDIDGSIWAGSGFGHGLVHFGAGQTKYDQYNSGLPSRVVKDIFIDQYGTKWFISAGSLVRFDGEIWTVYSDENSQIGNAAKFLNGPNNVLWLKTSSGIFSIDY